MVVVVAVGSEVVVAGTNDVVVVVVETARWEVSIRVKTGGKR